MKDKFFLGMMMTVCLSYFSIQNVFSVWDGGFFTGRYTNDCHCSSSDPKKVDKTSKLYLRPLTIQSAQKTEERKTEIKKEIKEVDNLDPGEVGEVGSDSE